MSVVTVPAIVEGFASCVTAMLTVRAVALLVLLAFLVTHLPRWLYICHMDYKHNQNKFMNKRGFSRWNCIGNLWQIHSHMANLHDFLIDAFSEFCRDANRKSGRDENFPMSTIVPLPVFRITGANSPENLEHVLRTNFENYPKGQRFQEVFQDLLGDGIFNADGQQWKEHRKTASHEFTVVKFREYYSDVFNRHASRVLEWLDSKPGQDIDVQDLFQKYTLDSIGEIGFGTHLGCLDSEGPVPFATAFDAAQQRSYMRISSEQGFWKLKRLLNIGDEAKMKGWIAEIREFTQSVIDSRRREIARGDAPAQGDILSRFMALRHQDGNAYSDQELRDVVLNFILAGRDTTSNALTWTLHLLTDHPEVEQRVREELQGLEGELSFSDLSVKERPYLHAMVTEVLRLYPSVPFELKEVKEDDFLPDGTFVPGGSCVTYSPFGMGRSKANWGDDALSFRPERWLNEEGAFERASQYKYAVFNAGYRLCLGMDMALLEIKTMVALLLCRFRPTKVPGQDIQYAITLTCPAKNGLKVSFERV